MPPAAPRIPVRRVRHGQAEIDNYAWMRDHSAPALLDYLAAERAYYDACAQRTEPLAARLYAEAAARLPAGTEYSAAWTRGGWVYRTRTAPGAEAPQLLRSRPGNPAEHVVLDQNELAAGTGHADVGSCEPSPDGALLAWSADTTGAEIYALRIRDLSSRSDLPAVIERSYPGVAWSADSEYLFYLVPDELNRPYQVWRHRVGTAAAADMLVLAEPDARFELTLAGSRSGELILITAASRDTTQVWLIPAADPLAAPAAVAPRRPGREYRADHAADPGGGPGALYLVTDDGAPEFTLMRAPAVPGRARWTQVGCAAAAPARAGTRLLRCDVLAGHLLLTLRRDGSPLLAISDLAGGAVREIRPSQPAATIAVEHAEDYAAGSVLICEQSLTEPPACSRLDLATGERAEVWRQQVPGYHPARYRTERLWAPAADGALIPVTIARRADVALDGAAPCLLYGYGAYEACEDPVFDISLPSLLDRGVVYAIAHVRGGGECGRSWWQQGRLRAKPTTFSDFTDVADWLAGDAPAGRPLVDGTRIACRGLSAGGLLAGAVYSRAPDRWRAVVAEVPFVDCVTTMLDPGIPLTISEWDEWGDPRDPGDYACLRAYSPYDTPPAGQRPDLLVTGTVHDPRVGVHEPAKWVARLRETDTQGSVIVLRAELGAGAHTGPSGRQGRLRYEAEVQAFVLAAMGIPD